MRNLKKVLSLVLCVAMMLSVMVMSTGAVTITDADDISPQYAEAAEVLTGMGIINGYEDDSFQPQQLITRAEVSTLIYRAATADVNNGHPGLTAGANLFDDVNEDDWFAGYVNYCADAKYIKGYEDDTFRADNNVTGYEVLAMILRAVGYDKNNEFTGLSWTIQVASTATELGMLENLDNSVSLAAPATREVVAELIFRAIEPGVDTVHYSPAAGDYLSDRDGSLGQQKFDLASKPDADVWGRPNVEWYKANTSTVYATIEQDAVYTNNVKVDECDIAEAIGLTKAADIEAAYIDGELQTKTNSAVTTDRDGDIDPLATTSLVGAQGRQLEIYDMGDAGYRIVEINTYLARVDKVTPSTTDKNGHTTDATVDLAVYLINSTPDQTNFDKVVATGFEKDDYVLVTITRDDNTVRSIELAPVVAGGEVDGWTTEKGTTAATTTVGDETYTEANKFFLNRNTDGVFNVITDTYGNVIGLAPVETNYLVIEAIEWKHDGTLRGGYALADVVLADGTRAEDVTVSTVGGHDVSCADTTPITFGAAVSDRYALNTQFYDHLITYTVDANGDYALGEKCNNNVDEPNLAVDLSGAVITKGQSTIYSSNEVGKVVADNSTVYLVKGDDDTYTTYVGKDNVPSMKAATICYLVGEDGFLSVVVVTDYADLNNTFLAYVTDNTADSKQGGHDGYQVYKLGETDPTTVYETTADTFKFDHATGLYLIEVNSKNEIQDMSAVACDGVSCDTNICNNSASNIAVTDIDYIIDRMHASSEATTGVLQTVNFGTTGTGANKDFIVNDSTVYIEATVDADDNVAKLAAADASDVEKGDLVLVLYTKESVVDGTNTSVEKATASYVYIIKADEIIDNPVSPVTYTVNTDNVTASLDSDKKTISVGKAKITSSDNSQIPVKAITVTVEVQTLASATGTYTTVTSGTAQIPTATAQASPYEIGSAAVQLKDTLTPGTYNVIVTVSIGGTTSSNTVSLTVS